jgi:hypothetical protein
MNFQGTGPTPAVKQSAPTHGSERGEHEDLLATRQLSSLITDRRFGPSEGPGRRWCSCAPPRLSVCVRLGQNGDRRRSRLVAVRPRRALALLAALILMGSLMLPAAIAAGVKKAPPLPGCFKTGSGFGTCEGMVIPGGGSVTKVEAANAGKDKFKFTGPTPLQSKNPVACGDAGCVYNHLDWTVGNGATVISHCKTNDTQCIVKVPKRMASWAVVYVRQNNDPKQLWAIWNSGRREFEVSGTIKTSCVGHSRCSASARVPIADVPVTLRGATTERARTDVGGRWSVSVPDGTYVASPGLGGGYSIDPHRRHVKVRGHDVKDVNFTACPAAHLASAAMKYSGRSAASTCFNKVSATYTPGASQMTVFWRAAQVCGGALYRGVRPITWYNNVQVPASPQRNGAIAQINSDGTPAVKIVINTKDGIGAVRITASSASFETHPSIGSAGASDFEILDCHPHDEDLTLRP